MSQSQPHAIREKQEVIPMNAKRFEARSEEKPTSLACFTWEKNIDQDSMNKQIHYQTGIYYVHHPLSTIKNSTALE